MSREQFTVKDHLRGKDAVIVSLYERPVQLVEAGGEFEYVVGKDGIFHRIDCQRSATMARLTVLLAMEIWLIAPINSLPRASKSDQNCRSHT